MGGICCISCVEIGSLFGGSVGDGAGANTGVAAAAGRPVGTAAADPGVGNGPAPKVASLFRSYGSVSSIIILGQSIMEP